MKQNYTIVEVSWPNMWLKDDYEKLLKVSILSLSLCNTNVFSISKALPYMFEYYKWSPLKVRSNLGIPSCPLGLVPTLFSTPLSNASWMRKMIVNPLNLRMVPSYNQAYPILLLLVPFFGMGVGLTVLRLFHYQRTLSRTWTSPNPLQRLCRGRRDSPRHFIGRLPPPPGWTSSFLAYGAGFNRSLLHDLCPYHQARRKSALHKPIIKNHPKKNGS